MAFMVLPSTPRKIKWQVTPGFYRILVSDNGSNFVEKIFIAVWDRPGWSEFPFEIEPPTNKYYRVVSP